MIGLNKRSHLENVFALGTSFASVCNALLESPQKVLLVVHGTVFGPAPWARGHPAGTAPGATPSKDSDSSVVYTGVPVFSVSASAVDPSVVETLSVSGIGVPAGNDAATCSRKGVLFVTVVP